MTRSTQGLLLAGLLAVAVVYLRIRGIPRQPLEGLGPLAPGQRRAIELGGLRA